MSYQIDITNRAMDDADAAYARIAEHSPRLAASWYQKLFQQIDTLAELPTRCPLAREDHKFPVEIRELLYGKRDHKYRIIFTIRDVTTVVILYVYYGGRKEIDPD